MCGYGADTECQSGQDCAGTMNKEAYAQYLQFSRRWRIVRAVRLWLDGRRCLFCYAADGEVDRQGRKRHIEVHHRDYRWCNRGWLGGILREIADTGVYCNVCHRAGHNENELSSFLDMPKRSYKISVLLLVFVLFVLLGIQNALYGLLAVLLSILTAAYMLIIALFFYRA